MAKTKHKLPHRPFNFYSSSATLICVNVFILLMPDKSSGHLYDILKVDTEPTIGSPVSPDRMFQYVSAGVPQIFWTFVNSNNFDQVDFLAPSCKRSLQAIAGGLGDGHLTSYKFLDSAGKTPAGFIRSTISTYGDFDECLAIDDVIRGTNAVGKYCAFDLYPTKVTNFTREEKLTTKVAFSLDQIPIFKGMAFVNSLCLPAECSSIEIKQMLSTVLQPFGLKVTGDMNCDTRESVSLVTKVRSLTTHQIVAGLFISLLITLVVTCTGIHIFTILIGHTRYPFSSSFVSALSMVTGAKNLFWAKSQSYEVIVFDLMKTGIILSGTIGHILVCVEMPVSYYMLGRHETLNYIFSSPETQLLLNDAGLIGVTVLTGIATSLIAYPLAIKSKLPFLPALFDRYLRFAPALAVLTAFEFLWPLAGNGPIFSRVANFILNKCTKNWWLNLLFINNALDAIDICAGSSFYSSVDMHLFILGLIVIYILVFNPKLAFVICGLLSVAAYVRISYNIITHETLGVLFQRDPIPIKISEYLDYVHMTTTIYFPGYLLGILIGYLMVIGKASPLLISYKDHFKWLIGINISFGSVTLCTLLYNSFELIPKSMAFLVVIHNRSMQAIAVSLSFLYLTSLKPLVEQFTKSNESNEATTGVESVGRDKENNSGSTVEQKNSHGKLNILKALSRLSFSLYICNYLVIRTLFFSSRNPFPTGGFDMVTRCISFLVLIYIASTVFHLLFLSPLDEVRKLLTSAPRKHEKIH